jgi:hypothetical protein
MTKLKTTSEPVLVLHDLAALFVGGGSAAALIPAGNVDTIVKVVVPLGVAAGIKLLGWLNRRYVSPTWKVAQAKAASVGISLPDEQVAIADGLKYVETNLPDWIAQAEAIRPLNLPTA